MPTILVDAPLAATTLGLGYWNGGVLATGQERAPAAATVDVGPGSVEYPQVGVSLVPGRSTAPVNTKGESGLLLRMMKYQVNMASLIRDGRSGGCAIGVNLGFRLVRGDSFTERLLDFGRKVREALG